MGRTVRKVTVVLALVVVGFASCKASVKVGNVPDDAATVESVEMALGYENDEAVDPTDVFPTDTEAIYAVVTVSNPTDEEVDVRAEWIAVDAGGEVDTKIVDHTETVSPGGEGTIGLKFTLPNEFPTGEYAVDVYLNDEAVDGAEFSVE